MKKKNITWWHHNNRKSGMIAQWAVPYQSRGFKAELKQWQNGREHLHMHFHSRYYWKKLMISDWNLKEQHVFAQILKSILFIKLRICTKKKQVERNSEDESNIGWSWLERWMATRAPEIEARTNIQANVTVKSQRLVRKNRSFSTSIGGELESCASNDIPLQFESISEEETEDLQREKSSVKASKSVPSYKNERRHNRVKQKKHTIHIYKFLIHTEKPLLRGSCFFCSFRRGKKTCNNKLRRPRPHPKWEMNTKKPRGR